MYLFKKQSYYELCTELDRLLQKDFFRINIDLYQIIISLNHYIKYLLIVVHLLNFISSNISLKTILQVQWLIYHNRKTNVWFIGDKQNGLHLIYLYLVS
jgi:hypothetical protein